MKYNRPKYRYWPILPSQAGRRRESRPN